MCNYKEGDKFIIEIGLCLADPLYGARYFIKGFDALVFDDDGLDRLEQFNGVTLRDAYDEGFEKGLEEGRNEKEQTMEKLYRVRMNRHGAPDFSTAVEVENEPSVDKDYLMQLIQEAVYDGEACSRLLDLVDERSSR